MNPAMKQSPRSRCDTAMSYDRAKLNIGMTCFFYECLPEQTNAIMSQWHSQGMTTPLTPNCQQRSLLLT